MNFFGRKAFIFLFVSGSFSLLAILSVLLLNSLFNSMSVPNTSSSRTTVLVSQAEPIPDLDANIPKSLYPCLPKQGVQKLVLVAKTDTNQANKITYYIVGVHNRPQPLSQDSAPEPIYQETLVAIEEIGCQVIIPKEKYGMATLTMYLPLEVAYSLSYESRRQAIAQVGGREKYQKIIESAELNSTPGDYSIYFPEDVWALKKLGIRLPPNIKVINHISEVQGR